mgnify:CR=1 FL=1
MSDLVPIDLKIRSLSPYYRAAVIKSCYSNKTGDPSNLELMGHIVALANYNTINGTTPNQSELTWLNGVG